MLKGKIIFLFIAAVCFFAACKTEPAYDRAAQAIIDEGLIKQYLIDSNIVAERTSEGLYYKIIKTGDSAPVDIDSLDLVMLRYVGYTITPPARILYDSTRVVIDTMAPSFVFSTAIKGWQLGLRKIKRGGIIRLIVPSTLAYQNRVVSAVSTGNNIATFLPKNSILDFRIKLIRVTKPKPIQSN